MLRQLLFVAYLVEAGLVLLIVPWSGLWERNAFLQMAGAWVVEIARSGHGMDVTGDRQEIRRRVVERGALTFGDLNPEVARVLSAWVRESMARPAWRTVAPTPRPSAPAA